MSLLFKQKINWQYAIGEVILIFIGITLAIAFNNWNEGKKQKEEEREAYENLLISLRKDSSELVRIIDYQNQSLENQLILIRSDYFQLKESLSANEINEVILHVWRGINSFFPKYSSYNMIVSDVGMNVIKSEQIKTLLIELYDYKCKRYENIDAIVDQQFNFSFVPFLHRKLGFFGTLDSVISSVNYNELKNNYNELVFQCQDLYKMTESGRDLLIDIQESSNTLISLILTELEKE